MALQTPSNPDDILKYSELDREIWENELEKFVPHDIFDAHTHVWNDGFATPVTPRNNDWRDYNTGMSELKRISEIMFPNRNVQFLTFPMPIRPANYDGLTEWLSQELAVSPNSYGAMLVTPDMSSGYIDAFINKYTNIVALKPYYALVQNPAPAITEYFPEEQMEVAHANRLAVMLHLPDGPSRSLPDLAKFITKYPRIQWILAHCAASGNPYQLERSVEQIRNLPNVWYDTSGNNDLYTLSLLLRHENHGRIIFGTDNCLVIGGCRRSKCIAYAYTTYYLHLPPAQSTFRCYEQLRIMRQACELFEVPPTTIEGFFFGNARNLLRLLRDREPVILQRCTLS